MKKLMILTGALAAFAVCADQVPVVSGITMTQATDSRLVTIDYTLKEAAAVITLDIQTNSTAGTWASIGGENIQNVSGDVWKKVEAGARTISWRPDLSWPDHEIANGGARAVVTAWSVDNPPDYMVVDLTEAAKPNTERYYPAAEFLPGGLLGSEIYRTSHLVMRKIAAKGVTWVMGSTAFEEGEWRAAEKEETHSVTLADNYYVGVFLVTQAQWAYIQSSRMYPSSFSSAVRGMRPVEQVCYNEIRNNADCSTASGGSGYDWPNKPNPGSFLGLLRTKTGLAFDLPSEAQWEFAARAGHGSGFWGDGSALTEENLRRLGRFRTGGGYLQTTTEEGWVAYIEPTRDVLPAVGGTAKVGSYAPNDWGLYDVYGNVAEWCLDWFEANISALNNGEVNVNPDNPAQTRSGATGTRRSLRSASWADQFEICRPARRDSPEPSLRHENIGFRLALPASPALKTE